MLPIRGKIELFAKIITIPVFALLGSHYVFGRRFPWQADYTFPWIPFLVIACITTVIWYANILVYRRLDKKIPFRQNPTKRIFRQFLEGGIVTITLYLLIYGLVSWLFFRDFPSLAGVTAGLLVCVVIASLINGVYIAAYLLQTLSLEKVQAVHLLQETVAQLANQLVEAKTVAEMPNKIVVDTANKTIALMVSEVAYAYSSGGMVWLMKTDGQKILTNLDAFTKLESQLPEPTFFRLNRQYIVHWQAVRTITEDVNRKLIIQLMPPFQNSTSTTDITVSRYRAGEFRKWFATLSTP